MTGSDMSFLVIGQTNSAGGTASAVSGGVGKGLAGASVAATTTAAGGWGGGRPAAADLAGLDCCCSDRLPDVEATFGIDPVEGMFGRPAVEATGVKPGPETRGAPPARGGGASGLRTMAGPPGVPEQEEDGLSPKGSQPAVGLYVTTGTSPEMGAGIPLLSTCRGDETKMTGCCIDLATHSRVAHCLRRCLPSTCSSGKPWPLH